jgi:hypothetical protein
MAIRGEILLVISDVILEAGALKRGRHANPLTRVPGRSEAVSPSSATTRGTPAVVAFSYDFPAPAFIASGGGAGISAFSLLIVTALLAKYPV